MSPTLTLVFLAAIVLLFVFLGRWVFTNRPPKRQAFPPKWRAILEKEVRFYQQLEAAERDRFEQSMLRLLERVSIVGVETEVEDQDRVFVAASAVIPLFGFPNWEYRNISEVLLYKSSFNFALETEGAGRNVTGMVGNRHMHRRMILSQPALRRGFARNAGANNVGIHEFVHLLDKADGSIDGVPEMLITEPYLIPWIKLMEEEMEDIIDGDSTVRPYGATNEAEFLSVVSEYFFNQPRKLERKHPELFAMLERMYRQDLT